MMARPSARSWRIRANSLSLSPAESAVVGSSMIRIFDLACSARAISTSCRWPIDSRRREVRTQAVENRAEALSHAAAGQQAGLRELAAEVNILRNAQVGGKGKFLVDDRDAGRTTAK